LNTKQQNNGDKTFVGVEPQVIPPLNTIENIDCMEMLRKCPPKHFDLAIVDPPYGIGAGSTKFINGSSKSEKPYYKETDWDVSPPSADYFNELFRVSKNQIIWGGNYFADYLGKHRCFIVWDKTIHGNSYADCEIAWTSFDTVARYYRKNIAQVNREGRIHPTQKPITLYSWLLKQFAVAGDLILDTHVGSGSSIVACIEGGFNYYGCEIDKDYYNAAMKRIGRAFRKYELFDNEAV